jgi:NAD(P)-dependent dehydrogenase (short-subunit alcohol dehydrogenase family)
MSGYFWEEHETLENLNMEEDMKQIAICALGPLHVSGYLARAGLIKTNGRIAIISSQAGSVEWRFTQNADKGGDYGHHMSRAACNIAGVLLSEELKAKKIPVTLLHPGFNRTGMTAKYKAIWDIEGAVEPDVGAKRVLHEVCPPRRPCTHNPPQDPLPHSPPKHLHFYPQPESSHSAPCALHAER